YEQIMSVYETAIQEEYRFGTYGDALLILDK
ncbi:S-adenosylmethionine:tRNA ribosyltransferase-isomerase, partial [termite gut metagenome]